MTKKLFAIGALIAALIIVAVAFLYAPSHQASAAARINPWAVAHASFDSRLCSGYWAYDTYTERYSQSSTNQRAFTLHFDSARYFTVAGASPACTHHIDALLSNKFSGHINFTVTGGNFNPDAVCSVHTCTGDTILQGIQAFARLTFGSLAVATEGDYCFAYKGGDSDGDAGDLMQQASLGVSCSVLGTGNQGDIFV